MKLILTTIIIIFLLISCGKKEEVKFEAFSPEAFAYDIGDSWEINATVNVKGFVKKEAGDELSTSLGFSVDVIDPDGAERIDIFFDSKEVTGKELIDVQLEAQFELDYNSPDGLYKIVFNITDKYSGEIVTAEAEFELKK
ncbi:MAG TPA: hypothetical protein VLH59_16470 [Ignavibacteriaceae bacterium]|nr:hypothetical protein [Ignavibacteriaceae bacterium]